MNTGKLGKTKIWVSVAIIIILGIIILVINKPKDNQKAKEIPKQDTKTTTTKKTSTTSTVNSPAANLSYSQALEKYGTNRLQINSSCQFSPTNVVYKVGTSVLLDNRSDTSKSVLFSGTRYSIAGYGFKVVTLNTAKTFQVDCGSSQNVATITVSK